MLKKTRTLLASLMIVSITLLFVDVSGILHHYLSWLTTIQFWPALLAGHFLIVTVLLLLTLIFGRIYCSIICPLGIMQDILSHLRGLRKKNRFSFSSEHRILRYGFLVIFIASFLFGIGSIAVFLSPYSAYGRIAENLLRPLWGMGNNILAAIAKHIDSYSFYSVDVWIKSIPAFLIAVATFLLIGTLAWKKGRIYCNTVCPVGTILGFFSRFSLFKVRIDSSKCNRCGLCSRNCKASCIDSKKHHIDYSRCIVCGDCLEKCHKHALRYSLPLKKSLPTPNKAKREEKLPNESIDSARRSFLIGAGLATAATVLGQERKKVDGGLAVIEDKEAPKRSTAITPPGSISAENMAKHCTGCQLCVSQCPNDILRPSTDLLTLMQPTSSYERGYCRPECTTCGEVCPTGAILPINRAEKSSTQIGHAVWVAKNCVPLTDKVECGNCARHCPTGAITMSTPHWADADSPKIPIINVSRCIGCGACENLCPARPFSAIYVEGHLSHRTI